MRRAKGELHPLAVLASRREIDGGAELALQAGHGRSAEIWPRTVPAERRTLQLSGAIFRLVLMRNPDQFAELSQKDRTVDLPR